MPIATQPAVPAAHAVTTFVVPEIREPTLVSRSWARSSSERDGGSAGARRRGGRRRRPVGAQRRPAVGAGAQVLAQRRAPPRRSASPSQKAESSGRSSAQRLPSSLRERRLRKRSRPSARQRLIFVWLKPVISPISA